MITTSGVYENDFKIENDGKKETNFDFDDHISLQMLGLLSKLEIAYTPQNFLNSEYNFLFLEDGKVHQVALGTKWASVWKEFGTYKAKNVPGALLYPNGRVYAYSGPKNNWNIYTGAMEVLGMFLRQKGFNVKQAMS